MFKKCHRFLIIALTVFYSTQQVIAETSDSESFVIPQTGFECKKRPPGFYVDPHPSTRCKVYHLCGARGKKTSFVCPEGTLFHQRYLVCAHEREVKCSEAVKYYDVNIKAFPTPDDQTTSPLFSRPGFQITPSPPLPTLPSLPPEPFPRLTSLPPNRLSKSVKSKTSNSVKSQTIQQWPPRSPISVTTRATTRSKTSNSIQVQTVQQWPPRISFPVTPSPPTRGVQSQTSVTRAFATNGGRFTTTSPETRRKQAALPQFQTTTKPIATLRKSIPEVSSRWNLPISTDNVFKKSNSDIINTPEFVSNKQTTPGFARLAAKQSRTAAALDAKNKNEWTSASTQIPVTKSVRFRSTVRPNTKPERITADRWENVGSKHSKPLTMIFPKKAKVVDPSLPVNDACPLCDPYFLEPGTCMPCVIIR